MTYYIEVSIAGILNFRIDGAAGHEHGLFYPLDSVKVESCNASSPSNFTASANIYSYIHTYI